jgi:hypothetical protein
LQGLILSNALRT